MRKVGVITFHDSINYGALLQTYALQRVIGELGYVAEVINYHNTNENNNHLNKLRSFTWHNFLRPIFGGNLRRRRSNQFRIKYYRLSKQYNSRIDIVTSPPIYDAYITGSDQVWNPNITGGDASYFLDFAPKKAIKISYAASFGIEYIPQDYIDEFTILLNNLDSISVREINAKKIINSLPITKQIKVVLDPTLLIDSNKWEELIAEDKDEVNEKYILCYYMPGNKEICNGIKSIASKLSKETGLEVINIGKKEYSKLKFWERNYIEEGPLEFLRLFKNAEYVVTNSFHGTAFSIIFNKQFYIPIKVNSDETKRLNSRIISLLSLLDLKTQLIPYNDVDKVKSFSSKDIDYKFVNEKLSSEQKKSFKFLKSSLSNTKK